MCATNLPFAFLTSDSSLQLLNYLHKVLSCGRLTHDIMTDRIIPVIDVPEAYLVGIEDVSSVLRMTKL